MSSLPGPRPRPCCRTNTVRTAARPASSVDILNQSRALLVPAAISEEDEPAAIRLRDSGVNFPVGRRLRSAGAPDAHRRGIMGNYFPEHSRAFRLWQSYKKENDE